MVCESDYSEPFLKPGTYEYDDNECKGNDKGTAIVVNDNEDNKDKGYEEDKETAGHDKDHDDTK